MAESDPIRLFGLLMKSSEDKINVAEAALLIARTQYPELDTVAQVARLDQLAERVPADPADPPLANIQALNTVLFDWERFSGDDKEYDDPRNSYLNQVLDRKKGIPITLSLVYMEVGRRRHLPLAGVGFPGHFLVKYLTGAGEIYIDPYHRGAILSREACATRLRSQFGEEAELRPEYFRASTPKQILARMLNNLKGSYFRRRDYPKVLTMIDLALAIEPDSASDLRDRGIVYLLMGRHHHAMADFRAYLRAVAPDDPQAVEIKRAIHRLRALVN